MIASEWLNVRSTPTAKLLLLGSMVMAAITLLANLATFSSNELATSAVIQLAMHSSTVATLTFALLAGVVSSTSDYRFGRMDQLLLSEPRPSVILRAKSLLGAGVGVLYGIAGSAVAVVTIGLYYEANGASIDLLAAVVVRPLIGAVVASALFVVIGIGLGNAVRNQPAAIAGGLALLLVIQPPLLLGLPDVGRWLPGAAGLSMTLAPDDALLGQYVGTVVLACWAIAALILGTNRLGRMGG